MGKKIQKIFDITKEMYPDLPCFDCGNDETPVIDAEYICSLQENIDLWKYIISCDIARGDRELAAMDRRQLQQVKIEYRKVKLMMQKFNRMETASA